VNPVARAWATVLTWGSTGQERALRFACDEFTGQTADALYRAVTVNAPPAVVFRWLCQLSAGPYSYDWIDNLGRRSPRTLTSGLDLDGRPRDVKGLFITRHPAPAAFIISSPIEFVILDDLPQRCMDTWNFTVIAQQQYPSRKEQTLTASLPASTHLSVAVRGFEAVRRLRHGRMTDRRGPDDDR